MSAAQSTLNCALQTATIGGYVDRKTTRGSPLVADGERAAPPTSTVHKTMKYHERDPRSRSGSASVLSSSFRLEAHCLSQIIFRPMAVVLICLREGQRSLVFLRST